jgi:hypothetical protein
MGSLPHQELGRSPSPVLISPRSWTAAGVRYRCRDRGISHCAAWKSTFACRKGLRLTECGGNRKPAYGRSDCNQVLRARLVIGEKENAATDDQCPADGRQAAAGFFMGAEGSGAVAKRCLPEVLEAHRQRREDPRAALRWQKAHRIFLKIFETVGARRGQSQGGGQRSTSASWVRNADG